MTIKFAINGFGRIGRSVARAYFEGEYEGVELVAINGMGTSEEDLHLFKYDSIHGRFNGDARVENGNFIINGQEIRSLHSRKPEELPWRELDVDMVLECSGFFKTRSGCQRHIDAGAKKILISAPAKDEDIKTVIYKVNDEILSPEDDVVSVGSCTTNCLAPVVKLLHDKYNITRGYVTTIHAYTNDQNIADANHSDPSRARAAALSMIPTSTGAAKAIGKVITDLNGKLDGCSIRVPTPNVSMIDFTFNTQKAMSELEINNLMKANISNMLGYNDQPLVSIDYNHTIESSIFDATGTKVIDKTFARVAAWYDNEWSFAGRMIDVMKLMF
ncbi:MAG: type I glyceraldehyde-3-phosphate dehydrogenase [Rickettsiales bacterium]|jgi:glyceraldehyde 3-phosphate dehydrogenase|nr:type I glyceraldehyde-3-phosphate dehydrogenase [Rickettsiales bacterium]